MDVSPDTKLNKQSTCSYKSFAHSADGSSPADFTCDSRKIHDLPKEVPLKDMASGSPHLFVQSLSSRRETDKDVSSRDSLAPLYAASVIFATGVTVALLLHIYLGRGQVFVRGVLVSDHERCTALGEKVLLDRGSSVDAAVAAALCLGVVQPHVSGVGGGGVMLVHDIHKNKTRVIDFKGTAPKTLTEEMLENGLELQAGLQVGVPGMLRGLHQAHSLYGSLSWEDVVTRAAAVAREGFSVSFGLSEAISEVKGQRLPPRFRRTFFPGGRALRPGSFLRMPALAGVLEGGLSNFYNGNFSQEMVDEVRTNGGVLSREDVCNYTAEVQEPAEGLYDEFIIQVPRHGAALISALSLLESIRLSENNNTGNQTYHWTAEALKQALAVVSGLSDPEYNSSVTELHMLSKSQADGLRQTIGYSHNGAPPGHGSALGLQAGQVVVMGPDDLMVSVASSLSRPFGSRLVTRSGVILNGLIDGPDFSRLNKTRGRFQTSQGDGERRPSPLMPTLVVPPRHKCGTYLALSSSGGHRSFSAITQVLISALSDNQEKNNSLSLRRPLVDSEFPEESVQFLHQRGRVAQRAMADSGVRGILRNKDIVKALAEPQFSDASS